MGTTADKLQKVLSTKESIRQAIIGKGVNVNTSLPFSSYSSKIAEIQGVITNVNFNSIEQLKEDWKYKFNSLTIDTSEPTTTYTTKDYDDSDWQTVTIPHDWSIYNNFNPDSLSTHEGGFLDGGTSWYRRKLLNLTDNTKRVFVYFDGVYKDSYIFVNGTKVGDNKWYNPFYFDITSYLDFDGNDVLSVYVRNNQPSSRWYSGSGIIRNVYLLTGSKTALGINDIHITSPNLENELCNGIVNTNIKINVNNTDSLVSGTFKFTVKFKDEIINTLIYTQDLEVGNNIIEKNIEVPNPILWDEYQGNLYSLTVDVTVSNTIVYSKTVKYGYRYFKFDANKGFFLNGRNLKLKGVCLHHDLGCIGAEVNYSGIVRQIRLLKEMGCNAIRITHNPASSEMLEICANEGMLVVEELFDCWTVPKKTYDFAKDFLSCYESIINFTVNRGKNNPAIIMYSIGNEIFRSGLPKEKAVAIATNLKNCIKAIDTERLVTMGDDTPTGETSNAVMELLDVIGVNYGDDTEYATVHENHPNSPIYGSETTSAFSTRGAYETNDSKYEKPSYDNAFASWGDNAAGALKRHMDSTYLAGMFVWTGFDYIGEPTPYKVYPTRSSYFGIIDLAGFPKDIYYMYQSRWTNKPMVHILPHWTHAENNRIEVWLYSNCYKVELFLNGSSMGSKLQTAIGAKYEFSYSIIYQSGTLVANGYDESGNIIAQDVLYTSYSPNKILLKSDKSIVTKDNTDLVFVECDILDKNDTICPTADNEVTFTCTGGSVLATDNGHQIDLTPFRHNVRKAFNGKCLAVIKPNGTDSDIIVTATSTDLISGSVTIKQGSITAYKSEKTTFIDASNPPIKPSNPISITGLTLDNTSISIPVNGTATLTPVYSPSNTTERDVVWSVSPSGIININEGIITPLTTGVCTVTCTSASNSSIHAECTVTITEAVTLVESITLNNSSLSLNKNDTATLTATVLPPTANDNTVTWSSNNNNIEIVPDGHSCTINAINVGSSIITVTANDGSGIYATCNVTINSDNPEGYTAIKSNYTCSGESFQDEVTFDVQNQTFYADMEINPSLEAQNLISIGSNISEWKMPDKLVIHLYSHSSAKNIEICFNYDGPYRTIQTITGNSVKIAINKNYIYVNGEQVQNTALSNLNTIVGPNNIIQVGSTQGDVRSISTYNTYGLFNRLLSDTEMAELTLI